MYRYSDCGIGLAFVLLLSPLHKPWFARTLTGTRPLKRAYKTSYLSTIPRSSRQQGLTGRIHEIIVEWCVLV